MRLRVVAALVLLGSVHASAHAQTTTYSSSDSIEAFRGTWYRAAVAVGTYASVGMIVMEHTWYRDRDLVRFHFYDDSQAYLQVDKFGHAFGSYLQSYAGYHWFLKAGATTREAILSGASWGFLLQTPIEIMDGIHEGWGFSWSDMAANAVGSGLVIGQAMLFDEQIARYKFSYAPSRYAAIANGYLGTSPLSRLLEDYNGHTYWLSVPLARLAGAERLPPWLCLSVGYGANGMIGEMENITSYEGMDIPPIDRYRQYYLSLDVDWSRVRVRSRLLRAVLRGVGFVKVPFPSLEFMSRGRIRPCLTCN